MSPHPMLHILYPLGCSWAGWWSKWNIAQKNKRDTPIEMSLLNNFFIIENCNNIIKSCNVFSSTQIIKFIYVLRVLNCSIQLSK